MEPIKPIPKPVRQLALEEEVERLKATIRDYQARAIEAHKREMYYINRLGDEGRDEDELAAQAIDDASWRA